jgi:hypothetical protein
MEDFGQSGNNPILGEEPVLPIFAERLSAVKILLHIELVVLCSLKINIKNQVNIYC